MPFAAVANKSTPYDSAVWAIPYAWPSTAPCVVSRRHRGQLTIFNACETQGQLNREIAARNLLGFPR
jgi:hypothetical protein